MGRDPVWPGFQVDGGRAWGGTRYGLVWQGLGRDPVWPGFQGRLAGLEEGSCIASIWPAFGEGV